MGHSGGRALLIVDVQRDFCAGGALEVPDGDAVVPVLNRLLARLAADGASPYASRDWHPPDTDHFQPRGGPWPPHCVAGTPGARFHDGLQLPAGTIVVSKGVGAHEHGYSAFDGRTDDGQTLAESLTRQGVEELIVGGLATDYCVKQSVLSAREAGFDVSLVTDAIRAVEIEPGDGAAAIQAMVDAGARLVLSRDLL